MEFSEPNPIIPGFAPDPSVCLIGDTFFLVNSSFHVFPGIPIYASKDLLSWTHIGNAINRPSQLSLFHATTTFHPGDDGNTILATGGLYAPTIRHHKGTTYILCTNVVHSSSDTPADERNFIIHTDDIYSDRWSDPIYYSFRGIDPSILFDDDGKVFVQGTTGNFQIYNMEIDLHSGRLIQEPKLIWTGWDKRFPEGPHVYKKDGWYYLLCAEGGTFTYHMVSMARSRNIWGPYEACPGNPVWTAHGTSNYIQHTGHADLFQDSQARWWAVMLGVRMAGGSYVMGRESFLTLVEWPEGEWPIIRSVNMSLGREPRDRSTRHVIDALEGVDWVYLRDPELERYEFTTDGNIRLRASMVDLTSPDRTVTFFGKRQRRLSGTAMVTLCVDSLNRQLVKAGLAIYKDEHRFQTLLYDSRKHQMTFYAMNGEKRFEKKVDHNLNQGCRAEDLTFRVTYTEQAYQFSFKTVSLAAWHHLDEVSTSAMTNFDFTGPLIGMFAVGPDVTAQFKDFQLDIGSS